MSQESKRVLVMGATPNPVRYSYMATAKLKNHGFDPIPYGIRKGNIDEIEIVHELPNPGTIDTITMYLGEARQEPYIDSLLNLKPKRIIFNPGAENPKLAKLAVEKGIEVENACTLVMLNLGVF